MNIHHHGPRPIPNVYHVPYLPGSHHKPHLIVISAELIESVGYYYKAQSAKSTK
jgi:hypothetical protein